MPVWPAGVHVAVVPVPSHLVHLLRPFCCSGCCLLFRWCSGCWTVELCWLCVVANFVRPSGHLFNFITALVVFYCISCTMDTANIFTVLVVIFLLFYCISCPPCCSLFRSYFLVVVLLSSVGWVNSKLGWVFPFLVPSASWPISARWRCSTSGGGCSRILGLSPIF